MFTYLTRWFSPTFRRQLRWLKELKALSKTHYSWCLPDNVLTQPDERHFEYVRISGAACLQGEYATAEQIATCVKLCKPSAACIGINLKPYHNTVAIGASPMEDYPDEWILLSDSLKACRRWLDEANVAQSAHIKVGAIMLDSERFYVKDDDPAWNAAITTKYNVVYDICKEIFPNAIVEWYQRGIGASQSETGWRLAPWNTFENKADSLSCDLYRVWEPTEMRETFRRTWNLKLSNSFGAYAVTPWIALGSGYVRNFDFHEWKVDHDYPMIYSWMLGRELNDRWFGDRPERFAPWNAAKLCIFYPPPFDPRTPAWCKHFVAYCRGAQEMKVLP